MAKAKAKAKSHGKHAKTRANTPRSKSMSKSRRNKTKSRNREAPSETSDSSDCTEASEVDTEESDFESDSEQSDYEVGKRKRRSMPMDVKIFGGRSANDLLTGVGQISWKAYYTTIFRHGIMNGYAKHFPPTITQLIDLCRELEVPFFADVNVNRVILKRLISTINRLLEDTSTYGLIEFASTGKSSPYKVLVSPALRDLVSQPQFRYSMIQGKSAQIRKLDEDYGRVRNPIEGSGEENDRYGATRLVDETLSRLQTTGEMFLASEGQFKEIMRDRMKREEQREKDAAADRVVAVTKNTPKKMQPIKPVAASMAPAKQDKIKLKKRDINSDMSDMLSDDSTNGDAVAGLRHKVKASSGRQYAAKVKKHYNNARRVEESDGDSSNEEEAASKPIIKRSSRSLSAKPKSGRTAIIDKTATNNDDLKDNSVEDSSEMPRSLSNRVAVMTQFMADCDFTAEEIGRSVASLLADPSKARSSAVSTAAKIAANKPKQEQNKAVMVTQLADSADTDDELPIKKDKNHSYRPDTKKKLDDTREHVDPSDYESPAAPITKVKKKKHKEVIEPDVAISSDSEAMMALVGHKKKQKKGIALLISDSESESAVQSLTIKKKQKKDAAPCVSDAEYIGPVEKVSKLFKTLKKKQNKKKQKKVIVSDSEDDSDVSAGKQSLEVDHV